MHLYFFFIDDQIWCFYQLLCLIVFIYKLNSKNEQLWLQTL